MDNLGEYFVQSGDITPEELSEALAFCNENQGLSLGRALLVLGFIAESQYVKAIANQLGFDFVDLTEYPVDRQAVALVSGNVCRRHNILPIVVHEGILWVATVDPNNITALDDVRSITRMQVRPVVATQDDLAAAINRYVRADNELEDLEQSISESSDTVDVDDFGVASEDDAPIVRFVNLLITQAISDRASDIHIEPNERDLLVRYRIDGVLHEMQRASKNIQNGVISRLKIMSDIDIAERRKPQDGRLSVNHNGRKIDLRVATLPTVWGEKVVMRILDNSTATLDLADLGIRENNYKQYSASFTKPYGMILVTGPTGSGKSTTLYATLNQIARPEINVITVEDPVEYRIQGINQVQVNPKAGLTFAAALRSILRADPDVVLVGEIRDQETAQIAIEAALTGHLVLSTLHTNDAPSAMTRLIEMDIEPFLVGSAVDCVVAQRLARRLCSQCAEDHIITPDQIPPNVGWKEGDPVPVLRKPAGCAKCSNTGYRGRVALHEIMTINEDLERLTVSRASSAEIARVAAANGMETLIQDGWAKAREGITSLEELHRVAK